jgi:hypothetical protein
VHRSLDGPVSALKWIDHLLVVMMSGLVLHLSLFHVLFHFQTVLCLVGCCCCCYGQSLLLVLLDQRSLSPSL